MRVLMSAPYIGEIGWELMAWQGRVRRVFGVGGFDRLVVLGRAGKEAFYEDMQPDYRTVDLSTLPGAAYEDRRIDRETGQAIATQTLRSWLEPIVAEAEQDLVSKGAIVEVLWPDYSGQAYPCDRAKQWFRHYFIQPAQLPSKPQVLLIKRSRQFKSNENWSDANWTRLAELLTARGAETAEYPCESRAAIAALSRCDLAVGHSTGGLHLASLCECPHLVWSIDDGRLWTSWAMTQRQRYETLWNPLGTPVVHRAPKCEPTPEQVADWTFRALDTIGRRTGSPIGKSAFRSKWAVRSWLNQHVVRTELFRRCPWPVQKLVRYKLV